MIEKLPVAQAASDWVTNPSVECMHGGLVLSSGYWYSQLKIPFTSDRGYCIQLNTLYSRHKYRGILNSTNIIGELDKPVEVLSDGVLFLGAAGHYHYFMDGIGNVRPEFFSTHRKLFVDTALSDDQLSFLKSYIDTLTPFKVELIKIEQGTYIINNVIVPINDFFKSKVLRLRTNLRKIAASFDKANSRIYVARGKANTRQLVNENEITEFLANKYDFNIISNDRLTLMQQLKFYWGGTVVVGAHGAGLTNAIFMQTPHTIVDIWHSLQQPFLKDLASSLNAAYVSIEGNPCCDIQRYPLGRGYKFASRVDNEDCWIEMNAFKEVIAGFQTS
jgi:hypothetical protein